jgi:NDP-sugar pyrophosphorylase family protein
MQAIILAAGMGKRLRPLTDNIPKCMVPVNGTPILINTLDILSQFPVQEVIIVVGHKREAVRDRVGDRYKGMTITSFSKRPWSSWPSRMRTGTASWSTPTNPTWTAPSSRSTATCPCAR